MNPTLGLSIILAAFVGRPAGADAADPDEVDEVVVVTAARGSGTRESAPYAISALDADEVQDGRPTLSLGESLAHVPGVFVTSRFNFAQDTRLSIRGFGARSAFGIRGVRVLLDGVPLTLPDGQSQIDSVDLAAIGKIEVLRGPAGSLYGNAAGGVLSLRTKRPIGRPQAELLNVVGAFGLYKAALSGRGRVGQSDVSTFASYTRFDGYRQQSGARSVVVSSRVATQITRKVEWANTLQYVNNPRADDPGGLTPEQFEDDPRQASPVNLRFQTGERLSQLQVGSRLTARLAPEHEVELVGHLGVRSFESAIPFRTVDFARDFYGLLGIYRWSAPVWKGRHRLSVGVEVQGQEDARENAENLEGRSSGAPLLDQREQVLGLGVFALEQYVPVEPLRLFASARYDRVDFRLEDRRRQDGDASGSRLFDQFTGQGGVVWAFHPRWSVFGNVSQSFETPTLTELVNSSNTGLSSTLEPQKALSVEGGVRARGRRFSLEATGYSIWLRDELIRREDAESRAFFVNAGRSRRIGTEVAARIDLLPELELRVSHTWLLAEFRDEARPGSRIPGLPEHRLFGRLRWDDGTFHAAFEVEWVDALFADDANTVRSPAYTLGELRSGARAVIAGGLGLELTIALRNVFDVDYADNLRINAFGGRYFEPGPPFSVFGTLAFRWMAPERPVR